MVCTFQLGTVTNPISFNVLIYYYYHNVQDINQWRQSEMATKPHRNPLKKPDSLKPQCQKPHSYMPEAT